VARHEVAVTVEVAPRGLLLGGRQRALLEQSARAEATARKGIVFARVVIGALGMLVRRHRLLR
jgi:hypothetical protein